MTDYMTLRELKQRIVPTTGHPLPTPKRLRNSGEPIEVYVSAVTPGYSIAVYPSGFALTVDGKHHTVMRLDDCGSYTYTHKDSTLTDPEFIAPTTIPEEEFLDQAWPIRVMLEADDRLQKNQNELEAKWITKHPRVVNRVWEDLEKHAESAENIVMAKLDREERLALLTERQREVFVFYYDYGYTQLEIGDRLKISQKTVCKSLQAARKKVAKN